MAGSEKFRGRDHRDFVGGMWDKIGPLQLSFMKQHGLTSADRYYDIGCGCLRGGVHIVPYLDAGNYFGTDRNGELLELGHCQELDDASRQKLPMENLHQGTNFEHPNIKPASIDYGISVSVFTHQPKRKLSECLNTVAPYFRNGGRLFVTFFEADAYSNASRRKGQKTTNLYHYSKSDMLEAANAEWAARYIGDWNHPRNQMMMEYIRL